MIGEVEEHVATLKRSSSPKVIRSDESMATFCQVSEEFFSFMTYFSRHFFILGDVELDLDLALRVELAGDVPLPFLPPGFESESCSALSTHVDFSYLKSSISVWAHRRSANSVSIALRSQSSPICSRKMSQPLALGTRFEVQS